MPRFADYPSSTAPNNGDLLVIKDVVSNSTKNITRENILKGTPLPADTVDTQAIEDDAVTTPKIDDGAVTPSKLATGAATDFIATAQDTTSTSYADLATVGPTATVNIGSNGLALVSIYAVLANSTTAQHTYIGFAVSGATTVAASDNFSAVARINDGLLSNAFDGRSNTMLVTGLNTGSNTFTMKYRVAGSTARISFRRLVVVPL